VFILPYDAVRGSRDPDALLLGFLKETYEAAADQGRWNRQALERPKRMFLERTSQTKIDCACRL
jgi:hypothetical protein